MRLFEQVEAHLCRHNGVDGCIGDRLTSLKYRGIVVVKLFPNDVDDDILSNDVMSLSWIGENIIGVDRTTLLLLLNVGE